MDTVAVMMSTYNGEKYLPEQIESILNQKRVRIILYIRDDGSSDSTCEIVSQHANQNENIVFVKGENCGVGNSFMSLVYQATEEADYYAFADQDDKWLPEKLISAIKKIEEYETPTLYCSNQILVDTKLRRLGMRYEEPVDTNYKQALCNNKMAGCTMVWNKRLHMLLKEEHRRPSRELLQNRIHDVWVGTVASIVGTVVFDMNSYIEYRQHENNVVGAYDTGILNDIKRKIKKIRNKKARNGRSFLARELYMRYPEYVESLSIIIDSATYNRRNLIKQAGEIVKYSNETLLGLRLKILLGLY